MSQNSRINRAKSGLTKTGFSRSFSCCARHTYCNLGKSVCFYAENDPEVQESCHAWVRNHRMNVVVTAHTSVNDIMDKSNHEKTINPLFKEEKIQQLSLFD